MALTLVSTPEKTINNILSNVNAGRSQLPYTFQESDLTGKTNYKVEIEIRDKTNVTPLIPQVFRYSPNPSGRLFFDVSELLTELHEQTLDSSIQYVLNYRAIWDEIPTPAYIATPIIQSIYAEKQLLDEGGSNMWEYLLNAPTPGKSLTVFRNPLLWKGFSRTVSVVMDSDYQSRTGLTDCEFRFRNADINKAGLGAIGTTAIDVNTITLALAEIQEGTNDFTEVQVTSVGGGTILSNNLYYRNKQTAGCNNLMYLGWVNSKGGIEQWMFSYDQVVQRRVEQGLISESVINEDIQTVERTKKRDPDIWTQEVILTAEQLTKDQLKGLSEIKQSDIVVLYLTPDRLKRVFVIVTNDYTTTYNTKEGLFDFSLQIEFPNNFDFELAKQY